MSNQWYLLEEEENKEKKRQVKMVYNGFFPATYRVEFIKCNQSHNFRTLIESVIYGHINKYVREYNIYHSVHAQDR